MSKKPYLKPGSDSRECRVVHTAGTQIKASPHLLWRTITTNRFCLDAFVRGNVMHKMTNTTMEIIEAMASNVYNDARDKRILKRHTGVFQVEVNLSSTTIHQKLDVLAKQMETLMKGQIEMMALAPPPPICDQYGEIGQR